jgi:hypothetical protein
LQGKVGKPSKDWFEYLIIDKGGTRSREMCAKWITKGKWPKLEGIIFHILQINLDIKGLEVDQFIDIILGDFQVLKQFDINNYKGSKLDFALRNKKSR